MRQQRNVYYIKHTGPGIVNHGEYTYDLEQVKRQAHDLAYALACGGAAYWNPDRKSTVFLVSTSYDLSKPDHRIEVITEDDGVDLI